MQRILSRRGAFLISAGGLAVAIIALSLMIAEAAPNSVPVQMLVATGQLAFTWYLAHIILGLGTIEALGLTGTQPPMIALLAALILFTAAALISSGWKKRARHGPLEWLMRVVCG